MTAMTRSSLDRSTLTSGSSDSVGCARRGDAINVGVSAI